MEGESSNACNGAGPLLDRKARPPEQLNCPRCNSTNTKFCYYNNYSLTQPRYFCKSCRRYWTQGGSLRNVPVGGGSRKNKRSMASTSAAPASVSSMLPDLNPLRLSQFSFQKQNINHAAQELHLGFSVTQESQATSHYNELTIIDQHNNSHHSSSSYSSSPLSALEQLRSGIVSRSLNSFVPTPTTDSNTLYTSEFSMQELKPSSLSFPVDGLGSRYCVLENGGRILFPSDDSKQLSSSGEVNENKGQGTSTRYWNGMLGGGSW